MLKTNDTLSLWDCISLDAVQKGRTIHENIAQDLLKRGLIEGEAPHYNISLSVAKDTHQLPSYTKSKGLDKAKLRQMVLQYLSNAGEEGAKRDSIYEYLKDVLPANKTEEQQLRMLGDLLKTNDTLSLWDCISLDTVQKGRTIHENIAQDLLQRGLIEGDAPHYSISLSIAKNTHQLPSYTKTKGLDKEKLRQMILQFLQNAGDEGAKRDSIYEYLRDVLPSNKTDEQQLRMVGKLLVEMDENKLITTKGRKWIIRS